MKAWTGAVLVAAVQALNAPAASAEVSNAPQAQSVPALKATEIGARRVHPRQSYYVRYQASPAYYARPYYYRPYPYGVPAPFFLGFGYLPRY